MNEASHAMAELGALFQKSPAEYQARVQHLQQNNPALYMQIATLQRVQQQQATQQQQGSAQAPAQGTAEQRLQQMQMMQQQMVMSQMMQQQQQQFANPCHSMGAVSVPALPPKVIRPKLSQEQMDAGVMRRSSRRKAKRKPFQPSFGSRNYEKRDVTRSGRKRKIVHGDFQFEAADEDFGDEDPAKKRKMNQRELSDLEQLKKNNARLKALVEDRAERRRAFIAFHFDKFRPFVGRTTFQDLDLEGADEYSPEVPLLEQPTTIHNGTMRDYQLKGLNFMRNLYHQGMGAILGDEMGLGKTLQTISLLAYLHEHGEHGPHLVVCPLSVLSAWLFEFSRWCPSLRVVRLHGPVKERKRVLEQELVPGKFDVVVTTYEMVNSNLEFFTAQHPWKDRRFHWELLAIDEAHRMKNKETLFWKSLDEVPHTDTMMLTGTPLQNNLTELWSLLHFMYPKLFQTSTPFQNAFDLSNQQKAVDVALLTKATTLLKPLMLRRVKALVEKTLPPKTETIVYTGMSSMQRFWYTRLLGRMGDLLQGRMSNSTEAKRLTSLMMQLRKVCNHPYLFPEAEPSDAEALGQHLIDASQKMVVMDKLLMRLKRQDHRVLIFSNFTHMLNILEDYCRTRQFKYCRLDGSTSRVRRQVDIGRFNAPQSKLFVYLISTRAGGLGINLYTADTVIHYDSDWNPQVDLQAQARAHRIGQKKPVTIYRLVTEGSVEERIVLRAQKKLYLDAMVCGREELEQRLGEEEGAMTELEEDMDQEQLLSMLTFGAERVFSAGDGDLTEEDLDAVLARSVTLTKGSVQEMDKKQQEAIRQAKSKPIIPNSKEQGATPRRRTRSSSVSEKIEDGEEQEEKRKTRSKSRLRENATQNAASYNPEGEELDFKEYEGVRYDNTSCRSIADEWSKTHGRGKRTSSSTTVLMTSEVGTVAVKKENLYGMDGGNKELSWMSTAYNVKKLSQSRKFEHMHDCFMCGDGGLIMLCNDCPHVYHPRCMGWDEPPRGVFRCPSHYCTKCNRSASDSGFLFRCVECPNSFCEDHVPPANYAEDEDVEGRVDLDSWECLEKLGYRTPRNAMYTLCSSDCLRRSREEKEKVEKVREKHLKRGWSLLSQYVKVCAEQHFNALQAELRDTDENARTTRAANNVVLSLLDVQGLKRRLDKIPRDAHLVQELYLLMHETDGEPDTIINEILAWRGVSVRNGDITAELRTRAVEFFERVQEQFCSWRMSSLKLLCDILGLGVLLNAVRRNDGQFSKRRRRDVSLSDPQERISEALAMLLMSPSESTLTVEYDWLRPRSSGSDTKEQPNQEQEEGHRTEL